MGRPSRHPKYCETFLDRFGKRRVYLRRPGQPRIALNTDALPWSPPFMAAYQAALDGTSASAGAPAMIGAARARAGSIVDVVARYLTSGAFAELAPSTRADRRCLLDKIRSEHGPMPL